MKHDQEKNDKKKKKEKNDLGGDRSFYPEKNMWKRTIAPKDLVRMISTPQQKCSISPSQTPRSPILPPLSSTIWYL